MLTNHQSYQSALCSSGIKPTNTKPIETKWFLHKKTDALSFLLPINQQQQFQEKIHWQSKLSGRTLVCCSSDKMARVVYNLLCPQKMTHNSLVEKQILREGGCVIAIEPEEWISLKSTNMDLWAPIFTMAKRLLFVVTEPACDLNGFASLCVCFHPDRLSKPHRDECNCCRSKKTFFPLYVIKKAWNGHNPSQTNLLTKTEEGFVYFWHFFHQPYLDRRQFFHASLLSWNVLKDFAHLFTTEKQRLRLWLSAFFSSSSCDRILYLCAPERLSTEWYQKTLFSLMRFFQRFLLHSSDLSGNVIPKCSAETTDKKREEETNALIGCDTATKLTVHTISFRIDGQLGIFDRLDVSAPDQEHYFFGSHSLSVQEAYELGQELFQVQQTNCRDHSTVCRRSGNAVSKPLQLHISHVSPVVHDRFPYVLRDKSGQIISLTLSQQLLFLEKGFGWETTYLCSLLEELYLLGAITNPWYSYSKQSWGLADKAYDADSYFRSHKSKPSRERMRRLFCKLQRSALCTQEKFCREFRSLSFASVAATENQQHSKEKEEEEEEEEEEEQDEQEDEVEEQAEEVEVETNTQENAEENRSSDNETPSRHQRVNVYDGHFFRKTYKTLHEASILVTSLNPKVLLEKLEQWKECEDLNHAISCGASSQSSFQRDLLKLLVLLWHETFLLFCLPQDEYYVLYEASLRTESPTRHRSFFHMKRFVRSFLSFDGNVMWGAAVNPDRKVVVTQMLERGWNDCPWAIECLRSAEHWQILQEITAHTGCQAVDSFLAQWKEHAGQSRHAVIKTVAKMDESFDEARQYYQQCLETKQTLFLPEVAKPNLSPIFSTENGIQKQRCFLVDLSISCASSQHVSLTAPTFGEVLLKNDSSLSNVLTLGPQSLRCLRSFLVQSGLVLAVTGFPGEAVFGCEMTALDFGKPKRKVVLSENSLTDWRKCSYHLSHFGRTFTESVFDPSKSIWKRFVKETGFPSWVSNDREKEGGCGEVTEKDTNTASNSSVDGQSVKKENRKNVSAAKGHFRFIYGKGLCFWFRPVDVVGNMLVSHAQLDSESDQKNTDKSLLPFSGFQEDKEWERQIDDNCLSQEEVCRLIRSQTQSDVQHLLTSLELYSWRCFVVPNLWQPLDSSKNGKSRSAWRASIVRRVVKWILLWSTIESMPVDIVLQQLVAIFYPRSKRANDEGTTVCD